MNLRTIRKGRGLTQAALGEAAGMDQATISRIERGQRQVTLGKLRALSKALGVKVTELIEEAA